MLLRKVKDIYNKLQKTFCETDAPKSDLLLYLKEKEQYFTLMNFSILQIIIKNASMMLRTITLSYYLISVLGSILTLYLLYKKKLWLIKLNFFISLTLLPLFDAIQNPSEPLLVSPLVGPTVTILCLLGTRSTIAGIITFAANIYSVYLAKPGLINQLFTGGRFEIESFISELVITSVNCNECACILFFTLCASNNLLMSQLVDESEKLRKANLKLEETNIELQSKTTFLLSISHDLKNPLHATLGCIDLALDMITDIKARIYLKNSKVSGDMLLFLVNNLLDSAKMKKSTLEISKIPYKTKDFLHTILITSSALITKVDLKGKFYIAKDIPSNIVIDSHRLMQVIFNLVGNAAKFTNQYHTSSGGMIVIVISWINHKEIEDTDYLPIFSQDISNGIDLTEVTTELTNKEDLDITTNISLEEEKKQMNVISKEIMHSDSDEDIKIINKVRITRQFQNKDFSVKNNFHLLQLNQSDSKFVHTIDFNLKDNKINSGILKITVLDNGSGMSKTAVSNLFKQFNQYGSSDSNRLGTGMGLWISKHLSENMLGNIKAFSKENKGSAFVCLIKTDIGIIDQPILRPEIALSSSIPKPNFKVMIVDDIKLNCHICLEFLNKCGINNIEIALNGQEALNKFQSKGKNYFDVIFMDVEMPVMNGKEASCKIREFEMKNNWKPVCLVMITGNTSQQEIADYININKGIKANFVFSKPFTFSMCQKFINNLK